LLEEVKCEDLLHTAKKKVKTL